MVQDVQYNFSGRNYIVVGASSGMGKKVAEEIAQAGGTVLAIARREDRLMELAEIYPKQIIPGSTDIRKYEQVVSIIKNFVTQYGKINGTVYTAGIVSSTPFRAYSEDVGKEIMDVGFWAAMNFISLVNRKLYAQSGAANVLISSVSAYIGEKSLFAYSATKAAMQVAIKTFAKEIYKNKIRVNTVSPGIIKTDMFQAENDSIGGLSPKILERHLLGLGTPEDVSGLILFLLSDRARWITGQDFVIDGGYLGGGV